MQLGEHLYMVGSGNLGLSSPLDCHFYLVDCGGEYVLVDSGSGDEASRGGLRRSLEADRLDYGRIRHILLTHYHCDHSGGAARIKAETGAKVYVSERERGFVERGTREELALDWYPEAYAYSHCPVDRAFSDAAEAEQVRVGPVVFSAISTPGHSDGSTCYLAEIDGLRALFSGDSVYYGGILGLLNFRGSDLASYRQSLPRLGGLNVDALLPGHLTFTIRGGQRHLDRAIEALRQSLFVPYSLGQMGLYFS